MRVACQAGKLYDDIVVKLPVIIMAGGAEALKEKKIAVENTEECEKWIMQFKQAFFHVFMKMYSVLTNRCDDWEIINSACTVEV